MPSSHPQTLWFLMKLSDAISGYWLDKQIDFSPHTITGYSVVFRRLIAFLDDSDIEAVTSNDIRRFLLHCSNEYGLSPKSLANVWITLSSLWTWAETEMQIEHIIRGKVKRPRYNKPTIETFTQDDIRALLRAAAYTQGWTARSGKTTHTRRPTASRDRAIILTLLDTGIRAQELCDLVIDDYDEQRGRLHIRHGKGDKARYVVLGNRTQKALWRLMIERGPVQTNSPLFATQTETHMQRDNLRHTLKRIGENAGIAKVYPHRFRHTFAINFLRNGGNVLLLRELLGHESIETVMIYARIADSDVDGGSDYSPADNWKL